MRAILIITLILFVPLFAVAQSEPDEAPTDEGSEPIDASEPAGGDGPAGENASETDTTFSDEGETEASEGDHEAIEEDDEGIRFNAPSPDGPTYEFNTTRASLEVTRPNTPAARAQIEALIEYVDEDGDGAYDLGEQVARRLILRDLPVNTGTPEEGTRDAAYALGDNASFTLRLRVASDEKAKYDIIIQNYPAATNTRLAVSATLDLGVPAHVTIINGQPAVAGQEGSEVPFLSWVTTVATAEGNAPVIWSVHSSTTDNGTDSIIYWSYPSSSYILHDPTLGFIERTRDLAGSIVPFVASFAAAMGAMGAGFLVRRRFA